jgi:hypothetical protein
MSDFDPAERARETYVLAYERALLARQEWAAAGRPLTIVLANGVETLHPLWKALREAELDASKFLELARIKHRGPAPKAVVQASIGESPAQRLRSVK